MNPRAAALAGLFACAGASETPAPTPLTAAEQVAAWTAPGPHPVGYRETAVTYTPPELDAPRTLRLALWYPASEAEGDDPEYLRDASLPPVYVDAPADREARPLAIYSHGHQGYAEVSSFLAQHLASHGWVVAAPDHTGNTTFDGSGRTNDIYFLRPRDISAVLDHLGRLDDADPLADLDTEHTAVFGHSFGGYTAFALAGAAYDVDALLAGCDADPGDPFCAGFDEAREALFRSGLRDHRVSTTVAMAPGDARRFGAGIGERAAPTLLLTGELDGSTTPDPTEDPFGRLMSLPDDVHLRALGAGHNAFTDLAVTALDDASRKDAVWAAIRVGTLAQLSATQGGIAPSTDATVDELLAEIPASAAIRVGP